MLAWLQQTNLWMDRHLFKYQTTRKAKIGWLLGLSPQATFRDHLKTNIETQMANILNEMENEDRDNYIAQHLPDYDPSQSRPNLEIILRESKPSWTVKNKKNHTQALALICPRSDMYLIMDLLAQIYPGTPTEHFDRDHVFKFVPFGLPFDKSLPNPSKAYVDLLQEQNLFLSNHVSIAYGGLSFASMSYINSRTDLAMQDVLQASKFFTAIDATPVINTSGKWLFSTTHEKAAEAIKYLLDYLLKI